MVQTLESSSEIFNALDPEDTRLAAWTMLELTQARTRNHFPESERLICSLENLLAQKYIGFSSPILEVIDHAHAIAYETQMLGDDYRESILFALRDKIIPDLKLIVRNPLKNYPMELVQKMTDFCQDLADYGMAIKEQLQQRGIHYY